MIDQTDRKMPSDKELLDTLRRLLGKEDACFEDFQKKTVKSILNCHYTGAK